MKIFGIPISVDISFFLIVGFLGMDQSGGTQGLLAWLAVVFVSVLVHELGHALTGRAFGLSPRIRLYGMGGLTSWSTDRDVGPARRIAISLAGPFAGFALGGLVYLAFATIPILGQPRFSALRWMCLWVNIGWGVLNLVPILPLDGGNVVRSAIELVTGRSGDLPTRMLSVALAAVLALWALAAANPWAAFLAVWFGFSNVTALVEERREREDESVLRALDSAWEAVEHGRGPEVIATLDDVARVAKSRATKRRAAEALVYAHLQAHDAARARSAYGTYAAAHTRNPYLEGAIALASGEPERAIEALEPLFNTMPVARVGRELCRAYVRTGRYEKALALCSHPVAAAYAADLYAAVFEESFRAGRFHVAAEAGAEAANRTRDPMAAYNVACALARDGRADEALAWLERAAEYGFVDVDLAAGDEDLVSLRARPEFRAFLTEIESTPGGASRRDSADSQVP